MSAAQATGYANAKQTKTQAPQASQAEATPTPKPKKAAPPTRPCVCGCGQFVRRWFAQGHDQRVRGMLQRGESNVTLAAAIASGLVLREHAEHPPTGKAGAGFRLLAVRKPKARETKAA